MRFQDFHNHSCQSFLRHDHASFVSSEKGQELAADTDLQTDDRLHNVPRHSVAGILASETRATMSADKKMLTAIFDDGLKPLEHPIQRPECVINGFEDTEFHHGESFCQTRQSRRHSPSDAPRFRAKGPAACIACGMQENVLDFLLKPVNAEILPGLVARAYAQYYDVDWEFVGEDLDFIEDSLSRITEREREVLDLLVEGYPGREIGSQLGVSTKTIEAHRARINDKIRSDDLVHLVRMVLASRNA